MLVAARAAKEKLSNTDHVVLACPLEAGDLNININRACFDELVGPLIQRTLSAVRKVLRDAKTDKAEVNGIVMVGGRRACRSCSPRSAISSARRR